ncbi:MAG: glycosyltransferase family 2 protein [Thermoleophilia bacterium]|nr:glycosyltransferase family 2 protein [Thermoleophilia bacterium]
MSEVLVVDNGSGAELDAARELPGVRVVEPGRNVGFAAGCNLGAEVARGDVLVFLNPDTVVAPGAVAVLAERAAEPGVGMAMARLRLLDRPDVLNSAGNVLHVSGIAWAGRYGEPVESVTEPAEVPYASGAALAIRRALFHELGGFTDELFMYQEDLELCWKARLRGLRVVVEPSADVFHDYRYDRNPQKRYLLERNRLVFVVSAFSGRLLAVLSPVLLAAELSLAALALRQGWLRDKARGWAWCLRHAGWLLRHRRETQRLRRVPDRELTRWLTPVLDPAMLEVPGAVRLLNPLLSAYWSLARRLV